MREIRAVRDADRAHLAEIIEQSWGSTLMSTRGRTFDVRGVPGFVADSDGEWLGYVGYELYGQSMEIAILESFVAGQGVGSALLAACASTALGAGAGRLWLITTNDNVDALRFYQRRGFVLVAVHRDAVTRARETIKPELPLVGFHDIPLRDEIELELPRANWRDFLDRYAWPT
jgi:ribosomal protein S18 acetylase RimI-like enzyme